MDFRRLLQGGFHRKFLRKTMRKKGLFPNKIKENPVALPGGKQGGVSVKYHRENTGADGKNRRKNPKKKNQK